MGLTVALNDALFAEGQLYWDDGVRIGMYDASRLHKSLFFCFEDGQTLQQVVQRGCVALYCFGEEVLVVASALEVLSVAWGVGGGALGADGSDGVWPKQPYFWRTYLNMPPETKLKLNLQISIVVK